MAEIREFTDEELLELIGHYREKPGDRVDWDFVHEALMAQLILELRRGRKE